MKAQSVNVMDTSNTKSVRVEPVGFLPAFHRVIKHIKRDNGDFVNSMPPINRFGKEATVLAKIFDLDVRHVYELMCVEMGCIDRINDRKHLNPIYEKSKG